MDITTFTLRSGDGTEIVTDKWSGGADPKAVVIVAHGMGEHSARYQRFGQALVDAGYVAYAPDHRGHGRTAGDPAAYGDFGVGGWEALVGDLGLVVARARAEYPALPVAIFGHSMGSMALQQYLIDHSADIDAAALSGTTAVDIALADLDPDAEPDLSGFNGAFEHRTGYEWLSRDEAEVDTYVADPACGFGLHAGSMRGFKEGPTAASAPDQVAKVRPDLPIYLASGDMDPLAGGGELIELVGQRYRDAGVRDVEVHLYPQARHEILNETNRDEVTADLLGFFDRTIGEARAAAR
ncbi:MAG TPA: alpha/beta hydrolase [Tetrasphaera sp.]|uniref:alpha/beta hydrolase n=1 Tax=Nostocoides sp. TaxID=1917966 RepID=UPI002BC6E7FA|nr:alpha/beta hydrolase [Tetrasphaera sp.]HNQ06028.1 alpha/beta hydrolase [Tetrasphaera sp.]